MLPKQLILIVLVYIFCKKFAISNVSSKKISLVINLLDDKGLLGTAWLVESLKLYSAHEFLENVYIYIKNDSYLTDQELSQMQSFMKPKGIIIRKYPNILPRPDLRSGVLKPQTEYVTTIMHSWKDIIELGGSGDETIISISFKMESIPVLTSNFRKLIHEINQEDADIFLLGKNRKMTSASDWHDLSIAAFRRLSPQFRSWFKTFSDVYDYYSTNRQAYSMLEPRVAILEANAVHHLKVKVKYFQHRDVCSTTSSFEMAFSTNVLNKIRSHSHIIPGFNVSGGHSHHKSRSSHTETSRCTHTLLDFVNGNDRSKGTSLSAIEFHCSHEKTISRDELSPCLTIDSPNTWKRRINHDIPSDLGSITGSSYEELTKEPMRMMWRGVLRFRNATGNLTRPFCWDKPSNTKEILAASMIEHNISYMKPFTHPEYEYYKNFNTKIKAVVMSASSGDSQELDLKKYMTISKMYYAKRHGYDFSYTLSDEFTAYYQQDLFNKVPSSISHTSYFRGIMTKPIMMLDVMYRHLSDDWLVWTDDDVYINSGWTYLPLDVFLADVPKTKVVVMANYRSAFTNVMFIRNNPQGRKLMMDWLAIVMSGYIQCHGYDQAGLAALISQRISRDHSFPTRPLNYTCLYDPVLPGMGCNDKGDWSCDFKIEKVLYNAGFKTKRATAFFGEKISSYTKGCANDVIQDFHVITETETRPRLQCGHCTRIDEIESTEHWDGPLGGGNLMLHPGAINGFFFNHKAEFLMFESYLKDYGCLYVKDVVPPCEIHALYDHLTAEEHENVMTNSGRHILSLTDGYAFDLDVGSYCKIQNKRILDHQVQTSMVCPKTYMNLLSNQMTRTYMKEYANFISVVNKIPEPLWKQLYIDHGGGEGRQSCKTENSNCVKYGQNEDGQVKRRPRPWIEKIEDVYGLPAQNVYFERENYCETCRVLKRSYSLGKNEYVVDCRTVEEELKERRENINQD